MSNIVPIKGKVSTRFAGVSGSANDELSAGVEMGFPILGYKGKVWSFRHRGEEHKIMRADGDGPANSVEVVIVRASHVKSKIFYPGGYKEGANEAPDCFSTNGVNPDPQSKNRQNDVCVTCKNNMWGSAVTPDGKKTKACRDSKRLAVVPLGDIRNERFGGAALLRVPAASLQALASYAEQLKHMGVAYYAVGTRVSFDPDSPFQKFVFSGIRALDDDEADVVIEMQGSPQIGRILAEGSEIEPTQQLAPPTKETFSEQPPEPKKVAAPKIEAPKVAPDEGDLQTGDEVEESFDSKLDALLGD